MKMLHINEQIVIITLIPQSLFSLRLRLISWYAICSFDLWIGLSDEDSVSALTAFGPLRAHGDALVHLISRRPHLASRDRASAGTAPAFSSLILWGNERIGHASAAFLATRFVDSLFR